MLCGLLQGRQRIGLEDLAALAVGADAKAHVAAGLHVGEQIGELALAIAHDRGQHHQPGALRQRQHRVDHLADALRGQRQVVVGAVGRPGARVQQPQVVVDLGDGADRRARVVAGGLLLDADGRRQALDDVDVGLVHQLQELPRIGRQALDVAALALGVERIEGQAGLAGTRQPRDHDELVLRDVEVDVLQVVRSRTANADGRGLPRRGNACGQAVVVGVRGHWQLASGQTGHHIETGPQPSSALSSTRSTSRP